jgi:hypothetical protein
MIVPSAMLAQVALTGVSATVQVDSVYYRGDTLFLAHSVANAATSLDSLYAAPEPRQVSFAGYALLRRNATYLLSRL